MAKKTKRKPSKSAAPTVQRQATVSLPTWLDQSGRMAVGLFVLSFLLYANTFTHDFALDDAIVITENAFTKAGLNGLTDLFRYDTFYGFFQDASKAQLVSGGRYRPLSLVTFAIEYQLFGSPAAMHVSNALWYALCVLLVFYFLRALYPTQKRQAALIALVGALLFAVHPIHTEAVANIKGRDEIMSLAFALAAALLVLKDLQKPQLLYLLGAGLTYFLALLSKENAITFVAVIPLTVYFFASQRRSDLLRSSLPIWISAALFLILRGSVVGNQLGEPLPELMNNPFLKLVDGRYVPFTVAEWSATIFYNLGMYLQLLLAPFSLTHDYYPRHIPVADWSTAFTLLSVAIHLGLVGLALYGWRQRKWYTYAIAYYFLTLSIFSNVVFPIGTNLSERFLFMPSVAFALAGGQLALWLYQPSQKRIAFVAVGGVSLLFVILTVLRNPVWADNYTLFSTDIQRSPNSAKLRNALGGELTARYADGVDTSTLYLREAVGHLQKAIEIHPRYKNAYLLLGNANYYLRNYDASIAAYRSALALDPAYQEAFNNLPIVLRDAGRYYGEQRGDLERAKELLTEAYQLAPDDYETARLLGVSYGVSGNAPKAAEFFAKAVEISPQQAEAWFDLGVALSQSGRPKEADSAFQRARSLDPTIDQRRGRSTQ